MYGVSSRTLGSGTKDTTGLNKGLDELASGPELLKYFDQIMQTQFLPSGRVHYFPMCQYMGQNLTDKGFTGNDRADSDLAGIDITRPCRFTSLLTGEQRQVNVLKKFVDATFNKTDVPSTRQPQFAVSPEARCVPLNELPRVKHPHSAYVVMGAGKTAIDACLWLLEAGVAPDQIRWIRPRDAWLQDRANLQTDPASFQQNFGGVVQQLETIVQAESVKDLFVRLEAAGQLMRIDESVVPTMYRGAIVSRAELAQLRKITQVVRMGHVQRIDKDQLVLQQGALPSNPDWLYIDCTADGLKKRTARPVFAGNTITPQWIEIFQPTFSAAFIAHVEATYQSDEDKNRLCGVIAGSDQDIDWLRMWAVSLANNYQWSKDQDLLNWKAQCRTDLYTAVARNVKATEPDKLSILKRYGKSAGPASAKLKQLLAEAG